MSVVSKHGTSATEAAENAQTGLDLDTEEGGIWNFWHATKNKHWQRHKLSDHGWVASVWESSLSSSLESSVYQNKFVGTYDEFN